MTSTNGSEETNQTTGGNVTDVRAENEEKWRKATNMNIAKDLLEKVGELLDAEVQYIVCSDKKTQYKKIVIEYDHGSNLQ